MPSNPLAPTSPVLSHFTFAQETRLAFMHTGVDQITTVEWSPWIPTSFLGYLLSTFTGGRAGIQKPLTKLQMKWRPWHADLYA